MRRSVKGKENCLDDRRCLTHDLWANLNAHMVEFLDGVSLEALVAEQRERLVRCEQAPRVHVLRDRAASCDKPAHAAGQLGTFIQDNRMQPILPIYMDYSATTPVDPRVAEKMIPYLTSQFGNPASRSHPFGWDAEQAVENARAEVAKLVNCDPREIIWTSGATEGDNLAIKGAAHFYKEKGKHVITVKTEHKAVLDTCRELEREGFEVTYLQPQPNGLITLDQLRDAIRDDTILVSVMLVNNEIGVVQDIPAIGALCREQGRHLPLRRGAGDRQGRDRPADVAGRPDDVHRAQDLRPEGHRRAVRASQAARAPRGADARRRSRARHAFGHARDAPDRRHGRGVPARAARDEHRERARPDAARPAVERPVATSRRSTSTATPSSACRTTSTSASISSKASR